MPYSTIISTVIARASTLQNYINHTGIRQPLGNLITFSVPYDSGWATLPAGISTYRRSRGYLAYLKRLVPHVGHTIRSTVMCLTGPSNVAYSS